MWIARKERGSGHDLAGCAIPTLVGIEGNECSLHRMQVFRCAETFDCRDLCPVVQQGQAKARVYPPAIHVHRASAALSVVTALLSSGESKGLAQTVKQSRSRIDTNPIFLSVNA
jgi:hypothetical protein